MSTITIAEAKDYERWLGSPKAREMRYGDQAKESGLSPNSIRKRISNAKQFFDDAVQRELIEKNPFSTLKSSVGGNRQRDYFLTREDSTKILEACPDVQWRVIFALSRFGGLRCPSEHLALTWDDINWDTNRMIVHSPKTEHHEGGESRVVPLFPELREQLDDAFNIDPNPAKYVITKYRDPKTNLRTHFTRIIKRAGLTPWPKLFQNLRASRATELANEYPAHVAAAWLGHSTLVASKHYWQVTDCDFERAAQPVKKAAQNAAQYTHVSGRTESQVDLAAHKKTPVLLGNATLCDLVQENPVGVTGLEPVTSAMSIESVAESTPLSTSRENPAKTVSSPVSPHDIAVAPDCNDEHRNAVQHSKQG